MQSENFLQVRSFSNGENQITCGIASSRALLKIIQSEGALSFESNVRAQCWKNPSLWAFRARVGKMLEMLGELKSLMSGAIKISEFFSGI